MPTFEPGSARRRFQQRSRLIFARITRFSPLNRALLPVAVRSSATAEDLPDASFAGQQETYLNVCGIEAVLDRVRHVFASLYNDRAIAYRVHKGFTHAEVALSAGIQRMVRSDLGSSGVMFTLDTESGFRDVVFITSAWGLGETVVQGAVNPDEFYVHKPMIGVARQPIIRREMGSKLIRMEFSDQPGQTVRTVDTPVELRNRYSLTDAEVLELARYGITIERHYGRPMDIEWGRDGSDGLLYILQARPETVKSREQGGRQQRYRLKGSADVLASGRAIGQKVGAGPVRVILDASQMDQVRPGDVLVTDMTDPNWEPVMKRASAIVTNRGGEPATQPSLRASWVSRRWSDVTMQPNASNRTRWSLFHAPRVTPVSFTTACSRLR